MGKAKLLRVGIVAPVVAYLLLSTPSLVSFFYSWKLFIFIAGSLLATGALGLFALYCPGECKKFATAVEYANAEVSFFAANRHVLNRRMSNSLWATKNVPIFEWELQRVRKLQKRLRQAELGSMEANQSALILMDQFWHRLDPSHPRARLVCFCLFAAAILCLYLPTIWLFVDLVRAFFDADRGGAGRLIVARLQTWLADAELQSSE